ncbi:MAG: hypothetical protein Q9184_002641 [Pyrenodesmia sp. 2 TL-2023]
MNKNTSFIFDLADGYSLSAMTKAENQGWRTQFEQDIQSVFVAARAPEDIATGWAATYDRNILSIGTAMLQERRALRAALRTTSQVTRVPRAPFVTLVVLDLVYAAIGTCLMVAALLAVRKGSGIKDAQARLSTLAMVAESFESPTWGDDAKNVDMLFAERRGKSTRRVAVVKRHGGGRKFKQIVIPQNLVKAASPPKKPEPNTTAPV